MRDRHILIYDGECSLCSFQVRMLSWLDWFNRLCFVPISDAAARRVVPALTADELSEAIHCVTPEGRIHRGARAIRFVGMRMPLIVPLALVLWLPGVIQIAEGFYRLVSRNRRFLSRVFGCGAACSVLPSRRGHDRDGVTVSSDSREG